MAKNFIIDPTTVSEAKSKSDLLEYLDAKPNADKFKDYYREASSGNIIVELLSGLSSFLSYKIITARREVYLNTANFRSSIIGIAEMLGYAVNRGTNVHIRLTVTPTSTVVLPKYTILGTVKDVSLILLNQSSLTSGVQSTLDVVVGDVKTESIVVSSNVITTFKYTSKNVSEDIRLLLNDVEMTISTKLIDLNSDKYAMLTNSFESVDVFYLNTGANKYTTGDILKIEFASINDLTFVLKDMTFVYGALDSYSTISAYVAPEATDTVRINAPLSHEVQYVIRGRNDYKKTFKLLDSNIADTNGRDVSAAIIELTYVKTALTLFSPAEKTAFVTSLNDSRPFGVQPPTISDPIQINLDVTVIITLSNTNTLFTNIQSDVDAIIVIYEKVLEKVVDFNLIEEAVEALSYVRVARITVTTSTWLPITSYVRGKHVVPTNASINTGNDLMYEFSTVGVSESAEPLWPLTVGSTVTDGSCVWTARSKIVNPDAISWNSYYTIITTTIAS